MREIKFRAWDKKLNKMLDVLGIYFHRNGSVMNISLRDGGHHSGELILLQYTGLKDKNGVEIYEGDVVQDSTGWGGEVRFGKQQRRNHLNEVPEDFIGWYVWGKDPDDSVWTHFDSVTQSLIDGDAEVIGDIYSNPELLKQGTTK